MWIASRLGSSNGSLITNDWWACGFSLLACYWDHVFVLVYMYLSVRVPERNYHRSWSIEQHPCAAT